MQLEASEDKQL